MNDSNSLASSVRLIDWVLTYSNDSICNCKRDLKHLRCRTACRQQLAETSDGDANSKQHNDPKAHNMHKIRDIVTEVEYSKLRDLSGNVDPNSFYAFLGPSP